MRRFVLVLVALGLVPSIALAAGGAAGPPGGAAPKALVGTWRTTLGPADIQKLSAAVNQKTWELVVINGKYLSYPRALGLRPRGAKGDAVPFAVSGHKLLLSCLDDAGLAINGYGVYSWTVSQSTLRLQLVKEPCKNKYLRDRIVILTRHPWHRVG